MMDEDIFRAEKLLEKITGKPIAQIYAELDQKQDAQNKGATNLVYAKQEFKALRDSQFRRLKKYGRVYE